MKTIASSFWSSWRLVGIIFFVSTSEVFAKTFEVIGGGDEGRTNVGTFQGGATPLDFAGIVYIFVRLIQYAIPVIVTLALLAFFWGLGKFIANAGNETGVEEGKKLMLWGIIALFVMVSVWGIVGLLTGDFLGRSVGIPRLPQ